MFALGEHALATGELGVDGLHAGVADDAVELLRAADQHVDAVLLALRRELRQRPAVPAVVGWVERGIARDAAVQRQPELRVVLLGHRDLLELVDAGVELGHLLGRVVALQHEVAADVELEPLHGREAVVLDPGSAQNGRVRQRRTALRRRGSDGTGDDDSHAHRPVLITPDRLGGGGGGGGRGDQVPLHEAEPPVAGCSGRGHRRCLYEYVAKRGLSNVVGRSSILMHIYVNGSAF